MASVPASDTSGHGFAPAAPYLFKRHSLTVRITHWINALSILFLLGTGLNIFNAHPSLYWGKLGADADVERRWLDIGAANTAAGMRGITTVGGVEIDTTGVLGVSAGPNGAPQAVGFPSWATFPGTRDLATARSWHFFWGWVFVLSGLVYLIHGAISRHIGRDLLPTPRELAPANIAHDIAEHAKLRFPRGEDAKRYHILQKLAYAGTALVLLPLIVLTGLSMSPSMGATTGWLIELFGGRQTARSIHFIAMGLIVGFVLVHLAMVLLAGPYNQIRSMITGRFRIDPEKTR